MPIAKGSRTKVSYAEETAYDEAPPAPGSYTGVGLPIISEALAENINQLQSEELRADRAVPALRGGNIATGGLTRCDFAPKRHYTFWKHLLGLTPSPAFAAATALLGSDTVVYGNLYSVSGSTYRCIQAGITAVSVTLTATPGPQTSGTAKFEFFVTGALPTVTPYELIIVPTALTNSMNVFRGGYYSNSNGGTLRTYLCVIGGQVAADVVTTGALVSTTGQEQNGTATFEFLGLTAAMTALKKTVLTGSEALPPAGLRIEKQLVGWGPGADQILSIVFPGTRVASLRLTIPQEGIVISEWNLLGRRSLTKKGTGAAGTFTGAVNYPAADDPFVGAECYVEFNYGGTSRPVREANVNITNNIDENVYTIGSRFRREVPEGRRECTSDFTTYFESTEEYDAFKTESVVGVKFSFNRQGQLLDIIFPACKLTGNGTPQIQGQGVLTASYNMTAFKLGSNDDVRVEISCLTDFGP